MIPAEKSDKQESSNTVGNGPPARGRRVFHTVLYFLLLVAGIFAAYQGHEYLSARGQPSEKARHPDFYTGRDPALAGGQQAGSTTMPSGSPMDLLRTPPGPAGMRMIHADPGGFAPPPKALRRTVVEIPVGSEVTQQGLYEFDGTIDQAAEFYLAAMKSADYKMLSDSQQGDQRKLVFMWGVHRAVVILRKRPGWTDIGLTVIRPAESP